MTETPAPDAQPAVPAATAATQPEGAGTGPRRLVAALYWAGVRLPRKVVRILLTAPDRKASITAALQGARDGLLGRTGPRP